MEEKPIALITNDKLQLVMSQAMSKKLDQVSKIVQGKGHTIEMNFTQPTLIIDGVTKTTTMIAGTASINIESSEVQTLKHNHQKMLDELELSHIDNIKKMRLNFDALRNDLMENRREKEKAITEELIKLQENERKRKIAEDQKDMEEYIRRREELEEARKNLQSDYNNQLNNLSRQKAEQEELLDRQRKDAENKIQIEQQNAINETVAYENKKRAEEIAAKQRFDQNAANNNSRYQSAINQYR